MSHRLLPVPPGVLHSRMTRLISILAILTAIGVSALVDSDRASAQSSRADVGRPVAPRSGYVGTETCASCHQEIVRTYRLTNHDRTSALPSKSAITGNFASGSNTITTLDPSLIFRMDQKDGKFLQTAIFRDPPHTKEHSESIDIVIGSGDKGQTYLYWKGEGLFQLPISYWREIGWINSPGYLDGTADFDRAIPPRCVECHATYFHALSPSPFANQYDKLNFILNLSCERCHGPGGAHAETHQAVSTGATSVVAPSDTAVIVNPRKLSRDRQMDVCSQCHGGLGQPVAPAFTFVPGQALAQYIHLQTPEANANVDVHGNQVALLQRSRCYQSSANLTCTTCHNPHEAEKPTASYSTKCLTCHQPQQCGEFANLGTKISDNCIDCHMPVQSSKLVISELNGTQVKALVRSHWIKVYASAVR